MFQLSAGLAAFAGPHLWKRLLPASRARLGAVGMGIVAVLSIAGVWLMSRGYGSWDDAPQLWAPASWLVPVNNLLVLTGFYFYVASGMKAWGARVNRHPQLTGVILWAVAHLLVNGDLASVVLFGGLLVWAVLTILIINRAEPRWTPPPRPSAAREAATVALTLALVAGVGYLHGRIGPWPFGT